MDDAVPEKQGKETFMDLTRMLREKRFYAAVLLSLAGILLGASWQDIKRGRILEAGTFLKLVTDALRSRTVMFFLPVTAVLPCGEEYLRERYGRFLRFLIIRRTKREYCCDKVMTTAISGALVWLAASGMGMLFFFLLFFTREAAWSFQKDMISEFFTILGRVALEGSALASLGAALGTMSGSVYLALGLPFVFYYALMILRDRYFSGLYSIDPAEWILGIGDWAGSQRGLWLFLLILVMAMAALHWTVLARKLEEL